MLKLNLFDILKYKIVRIIESNPALNVLIYNNIRFFKFLLPHEKDYLGMKKICQNNENKHILDIGANLGISSLGFRQMGFKNKIFIFEPNFEIYNKYLLSLKKQNKNFIIYNFALGNENSKKLFFLPYYRAQSIHYFGSFDKKYLINSIKMTFPKILSQINIKKKKIKIFKFDDLKLNIKPHFVKIDVEGFDHLVLQGFLRTIKKYKPIFLIEYNKENYMKICKILKNYKQYIYNINEDKLFKIKNSFFSKDIGRSNKKNLLSSRNIYFIPK